MRPATVKMFDVKEVGVGLSFQKTLTLMTYLEDVMDVQDEVEDVERKPGQCEDNHNGHEQCVGPGLTFQLVLCQQYLTHFLL